MMGRCLSLSQIYLLSCYVCYGGLTPSWGDNQNQAPKPSRCRFALIADRGEGQQHQNYFRPSAKLAVGREIFESVQLVARRVAAVLRAKCFETRAERCKRCTATFFRVYVSIVEALVRLAHAHKRTGLPSLNGSL
jgi:hypothetical protein